MSMIYDYFVVFWGFLLIATMGIGGFFMFRKFLKQIPKADGQSDMDWERYYIKETKHMWNEEGKELLEELVSPVPELFRDVARQTIAGKIGEVALHKNVNAITQEILIEGYIVGTPKKDHRFLRRRLREKNIDIEPYEQFFKMSKEDYRKDWKKHHNPNSKSK